MKKNKLVNLFKMAILLFGMSILLLNCEKENLVEQQEVSIKNKFEKQFNKDDFKKTIPFDYDVDWSSAVKYYSKELETNFYEFELIYNTPFNPTTVNKTKKEGYNTFYKLVVTENEAKNLTFFMAKFFQEKEKSIEIEDLNISLNKNTGYKGFTQLYNSENELYFAKHINKEENTKPKTYFKNKIKDSNIKAKDVTTCTTSTSYNYIDWYRYTYDAYGNLISIVYLYTEYVGTSSATSCITEFQPDEPIRIPRDPNLFYCNDGSGKRNCAKNIEPQIMCVVGFEPDENGNCVKVTGLDLEGILDDEFAFADILELTDKQNDWINDEKNKEAKDTITAYLNSFVLTSEFENAKGFAYESILALFANNWMTINDIDFEDQIINKLKEKDLCIYNKLKNLSLFKSTIGKFMENSIYNKNEYDLTIEYGDCSTAYIACTSGADIADKEVRIIIEQGANLGTKPLEFAASLIHEGIHAEIFKYVDEHQKGLDPSKRKELLDWYFEYKSNNEPTLATSKAQHQYMADKFVKPIASAIRTLDNNKYSLEYYMGFGWDGLRRYGFSRYTDNGEEVLLTKDLSTEYYKNQALVNNNTNFNGTNDCN